MNGLDNGLSLVGIVDRIDDHDNEEEDLLSASMRMTRMKCYVVFVFHNNCMILELITDQFAYTREPVVWDCLFHIYGGSVSQYAANLERAWEC